MIKWTSNFYVNLKVKKPYNGKYVQLACMKDTKVNYLVDNVQEFSSGCSTDSIWDDAVELTSTVIWVLSQEPLEMILRADTSVEIAWTIAIAESVEVLQDKTFEFIERSSDENGITAIVVKDSTDTITYVLDTDYTVVTVNNITTVTFIGATILVGDTVNITWSIELFETDKTNKILWTSVIEKLDFVLDWGKKVNGVFYPFTLEANAGSVTSGYLIEFLNAQKGTPSNWAELSIKFDQGDVKMRDAVTPAERVL